ncbi:basic secretory protein-like protein [soil metagenome]
MSCNRFQIRWVLAALTIVMFGALLPPEAEGQYFGRNKVQYRTFDFRILQTPNFDIYFYPEEEVAAREAARMAERWYERLSTILDHRFDERQPIILYASHPDFQQTTVVGGDISEGVQGVTEAAKQRIAMPLLGSYPETDHVLGHELVHAFQYDISGLGRARGGLQAAAQRFQVPLWFIEGMAEYLSIGPVDAHTAMWVRDAALTGELPSIDRLTRDPRVFPYRWGHALWAYIGGRWGDPVIGQILRLTGQGVPLPTAFQRTLNISMEELSADWHTSIRRAYLPMLTEFQEPREIARPLITRSGEGGRLNVGPVVSPDGQWVAFLSEMGFLDIELHLANAETGEVVRRLVKGTALDPHFGSLRFINSAGTWSPDSRQFAFAALRAGTDVISIINVENARRVRELRIPDVHELANPNWSPDGRSIVVSGVRGGIADLYVIDIATGTSQRLTDDQFAYFHPAYSPDGATIAFVTDQGPGTNHEQLTYGGYTIRLREVATGATRLLPIPRAGHNINPVWARDGASLYFVSDAAGIANIYRVEVATGAVTQVTRIFTGVSGITAISPAISAARDIDRVLFTSFEANGYNIYSLERAEVLAGVPIDMPDVAVGDTVAPLAALLPPHPRPAEATFNRVAQLVNDPLTGLPPAIAATEYPVVEYRPRLGLDYVGQPMVGATVGGGMGGGGLFGAVSAVWSDILGRHTVMGAIQAQGELDEIGFSSIYFYSPRRWNFGIAAQRIPYVFPAFREGLESQTMLRREFLRFRFFDTRLTGVAQYPFSHVQRAEFTAGPRRIAEDVRIIEQRFQLLPGGGGQLISEDSRREPGNSFNMFETSAALVYDNSLFGFTSPFAGQRYRFELSPIFGQIQMVQATADYRRYLFFNPFTIAVRGLHYGRYGRDFAAFREMYVGFPWFIRGYDPNDVERQCRQAGGPCPLDQLGGQRIGVVNAELRFPLIRALVLGVAPIGFPPIEGFLFADAGTAWGQDALGRQTSPVFQRPGGQAEPTDRPIFTSIGAGARINVFGYMIVEVDYVNPLDRDRGWHWQFNFQPGF